jgi:hypothetical protein
MDTVGWIFATMCDSEHRIREIDPLSLKAIAFEEFQLIPRTTTDIEDTPITLLTYQRDDPSTDRCDKGREHCIIKSGTVVIFWHILVNLSGENF